jgi:hypothetical protein
MAQLACSNFLEYPRLVFAAPNNTLGPGQGLAPDKFPLKSILTQIQKDEDLLGFCRETLDDAAVHDGA